MMTTPADPTQAQRATSRISRSRTDGGTPHSGAAAVRRSEDAASTHAHGAIRVLCVDDHAVLVEGLKAQFELDGRIAVVGSLASAERLIEEVARLRPDVVLLDIEMPGPDAFEMADRLHHLHPRVRVLILSAHIRDSYLAAAYRCGCSGYFAKSDELSAIVDGVRQAGARTEGAFVMGPKVVERCLPIGQPSPRSAGGAKPPVVDEQHPPVTRLGALSDREREVLRLIGRGLSRNEIATQLSRSVKTIDGHQERILHKLDIASRADLMRFAIREGLAEA